MTAQRVCCDLTAAFIRNVGQVRAGLLAQLLHHDVSDRAITRGCDSDGARFGFAHRDHIFKTLSGEFWRGQQINR